VQRLSDIVSNIEKKNEIQRLRIITNRYKTEDKKITIQIITGTVRSSGNVDPDRE